MHTKEKTPPPDHPTGRSEGAPTSLTGRALLRSGRLWFRCCLWRPNVISRRRGASRPRACTWASAPLPRVMRSGANESPRQRQSRLDDSRVRRTAIARLPLGQCWKSSLRGVNVPLQGPWVRGRRFCSATANAERPWCRRRPHSTHAIAPPVHRPPILRLAREATPEPMSRECVSSLVSG